MSAVGSALFLGLRHLGMPSNRIFLVLAGLCGLVAVVTVWLLCPPGGKPARDEGYNQVSARSGSAANRVRGTPRYWDPGKNNSQWSPLS